MHSLPCFQGDSGGPLVCRLPGKQTWKLYGITSGTRSCSRKAVFTRVSSYLDWIENILKHLTDKKCTKLDFHDLYFVSEIVSSLKHMKLKFTYYYDSTANYFLFSIWNFLFSYGLSQTSVFKICLAQYFL